VPSPEARSPRAPSWCSGRAAPMRKASGSPGSRSEPPGASATCPTVLDWPGQRTGCERSSRSPRCSGRWSRSRRPPPQRGSRLRPPDRASGGAVDVEVVQIVVVREGAATEHREVKEAAVAERHEPAARPRPSPSALGREVQSSPTGLEGHLRRHQSPSDRHPLFLSTASSETTRRWSDEGLDARAAIVTHRCGVR
jgi:hypothetical protein